MGQVFSSVRYFRWLVMVICVWNGGNTAAGQQVETVQKILSPGDSLLIKELYFKGIQEKSDGQLAAAEKTFLQLIRLQPDNDAAHFELARIYIEKEDFPAAERAAVRAASIDPDNNWYWNTLLDIYKRTRQVKKIPAILDELIRIHPDKMSTYQEKAYVLYLDKQYDAALATYDTVAARFGETDDQYFTKAQVFLAKNNTESAIHELETLISRKPKEPKSYVLLAELYTKNKDGRKAIRLLDEALVAFPDDPAILLGKSDAYLALNKQKPAYDLLLQAFNNGDLDLDAKAGILYAALGNRERQLAPEYLLKLAGVLTETYPREAKAHALAGDINKQLDHLQEARQSYQKALDINQYIESIWQQLLQVELQMTRYDDVERHGNEALELFPNRPLLLFFTGHGYLGNRKYNEARRCLEGALNAANEEHTPLLTQLYSNLGDVYNALEMHAESDVAYQEAIALDSTNAYALNNYAYFLALRKEKLELAAEMAKRSNELMPDYPSYQDTYAWVLFQQGKYDEALVWIRKAIKNSEVASETLLEHYGDILAKRGDTNEAVAQWKKAIAASESVGKDIDKLSKKVNARKFID